MRDWTLPIDTEDDRQVARQLTEEIAVGLGDPWKMESDQENSWQYRILGRGEAKLYISLERGRRHPERVTISGGLHVGHNGQYVTVYENNQQVTSGSISVALKRGIPVIVKEIQRRYLPEYLRILKLCIAKRDADNLYINTRRAKLEELAKVVGEDLNRYNNTGRDDRERESFYRGNIEVRVGSDITLKISDLTMEQAKAILAIAPKRRIG